MLSFVSHRMQIWRHKTFILLKWRINSAAVRIGTPSGAALRQNLLLLPNHPHYIVPRRPIYYPVAPVSQSPTQWSLNIIVKLEGCVTDPHPECYNFASRCLIPGEGRSEMALEKYILPQTGASRSVPYSYTWLVISSRRMSSVAAQAGVGQRGSTNASWES